MNDSHLKATVSYVSLNPVRARLVSRAEEWARSSVRATLQGKMTAWCVSVLYSTAGRIFRDLLPQGHDEAFTSLRSTEGIGHPLGTADFVFELERRLGRPIAARHQEEGRSNSARRAIEIAAICKLAPHLTRSMRAQADLVDQLFNSSEKRLARILLLMAEFGEPGEPETLIPPITQETLADMIGTTRSRVSLFMIRFRKLGFNCLQRPDPGKQIAAQCDSA